MGDPEPPFSLQVARDRLELDLRYYSSADTSAFEGFVHKLKVGTKQFFRRPKLMVEAVRQLDLRAMYLPDLKRILMDADLKDIKKRWAEAHEIGHSLIWWHSDYLLGDSDCELNPSCHATIEAEAHYAAGQLLFLGDRFVDEAMSSELSFKNVNKLHRSFKNSLTSTLWRYVEEYRGAKPLVGIVSGHPRYPDDGFDPAAPCRYTVQSPFFRQQFSGVTERQLFAAIGSYCWSHQKRGPLGEAEVQLLDDNGEAHLFHFESFRGHYVLTLGRYLRKASRKSA